MNKKTVKVAYGTDGYERVRQGKVEHVRKYEKQIDVPELGKEVKDNIKTGKAKELLEEEIVVDWIPEARLKELRFFREEILTNMTETFDLLNNTDELEAFLTILTEEQRSKLYAHPVLFDNETNPDGYDLLP